MAFKLAQQVRALAQVCVFVSASGRLLGVVLADGVGTGWGRRVALDGTALDMPVVRAVIIW